MKHKRCKVCKIMFEPFKPLQVTCGWECAHNYAVAKRQKEEQQAEKLARKAIRIAKEKLKTRSQWMKEAQIAFNAYIRERDKNKPCICCKAKLEIERVGGGYDCGHYRSVGSAPHLRFDERNAHGQRKQCNRYGAGRAVDYRLGLIERIGLDAVEALEADQASRDFSIESLKAIKARYIQKLKELKAKPSLAELALAYPETFGEHA